MPGETHVPHEYTCWGLKDAELCYLWLSQADFTVSAYQSTKSPSCVSQTEKIQISYI